MRRTPSYPLTSGRTVGASGKGCPCEDRFVGVMERRQTELQVVSVQRRIEARDRDGELLSATRAIPEKLSTLRRLHIKLAVRVATPSRYVERLRARDMYSGMWGRMPAIQPARRKHRRSTEGLVGNMGKA